MEPELPRPLLLGEQTIPASEAQKRYRRKNMRNLDAGDEPEVNPSLPQTRRQYRFPRPCGLLDLDGGCVGSDGNPITSAETKRWNLCTATTVWEAEDKAVPGLPYGITHSVSGA
jgi:hypothetical protein